MIVTPQLARLEELLALQTALLDGGSLRLFKNDITPDIDSVLGDFTVADFTGYANVTIATWNAPYIDAQGKAVILGGLRTFTQTASTISNIVYGAYYLDAGGALVWAERFAASVNFSGAGVVLNVVPKYIVGDLAA